MKLIFFKRSYLHCRWEKNANITILNIHSGIIDVLFYKIYFGFFYLISWARILNFNTSMKIIYPVAYYNAIVL